MCYSAEVSLGTFVAVAAASIFLWIRNRRVDRGAALVLFIISFMQLLEFFLWMNPECNDTNKTVSAILPGYLYLQPALVALAVWSTNSGTGTLYPWIIGASIVGLIPYMMFVRATTTYPCIHKADCGHLKWNVLRNIITDNIEWYEYTSYMIYHTALLYVIATLKNKALSNIILALYVVSWLATSTLYGDVWGSVWCHSANAAAVAALLL